MANDAIFVNDFTNPLGTVYSDRRSTEGAGSWLYAVCAIMGKVLLMRLSRSLMSANYSSW